jgi:nickel-dependent lactate racemase
MTTATSLVGKGSAESVLIESDLREIVEHALESVSANAKVLAVIPDTSRDDNTHILFPIIDEILRSKGVDKFDGLVAQGTHPPISDKEKLEKVGLETFSGQIFDHEWNDPKQLTKIGQLYAGLASEASGGEFVHSIDLTINRLILDYDLLLVIGATVPHEVAGFSGGAKYFFPGISGAELTNATHWIGALAGIENIIGRIETPTRHLIEKASDHISAEIINFSSAVSRTGQGQLETRALFAGDLQLSFRRAAEVSREINVKFVDRQYKRVVAILDEHYRELWTGGKASYKLGGIIEDGGELVIYAPHLAKISETHGAAIEKFGYAPLAIVKQLVAGSDELQRNLCVAAHLAHVSYSGSLENPKKPKYGITMASGLNAPLCEKVGLGFADHETFDLDAVSNDRESLVIENAGRDLYLLNKREVR